MSIRIAPAKLALAATAALAALALPGLALANAYPSVLVRDQKIKSDTVSITYTNLPRQGTLAIFESGAGGKLGKREIGHMALQAGDHRNVKIKLDTMPKKGMRLWAVVEPEGSAKPFVYQGKKAEQSFKVL